MAATAKLQGGVWRVGAVLNPKQCRLESLRTGGLPFLREETEVNSLRVGRNSRQHVTRAARAGRESVVYPGYDIYELLGVDAEAPVPEIKQAYRWLQKRCHPDIAGSIGHDMAILLNEAYATLSNPVLRAIYDAKRLERAAFEGYTGQPLYSKWFGAAEEDRAIFVDETQCVGCLKCALMAPHTFAIENRYGRARAVGQWADSEATISDAMRACPVDCISFVQREQLPALEFVMSKQPRVTVGVDLQTYGGQRTENVFVAAEKILMKCAKRELSKGQETPAQKQARMSAAANIQARAGRWWHHFVGADPTTSDSSSPDPVRTCCGAIVPLSFLPPTPRPPNHQTTSSIPPDQLKSLLEAARRRRTGTKHSRNHHHAPLAEEEDEYWSPMALNFTSVPYDEQRPAMARRVRRVTLSDDGIQEVQVDQTMLSGWLKSVLSGAPVALSLVGAVFAVMTDGLSAANSTELAASATAIASSAGPLPAEVTSGLVMHMFLAAVVWYVVAAVLSGAAAILVVSVVAMRKD